MLTSAPRLKCYIINRVAWRITGRCWLCKGNDYSKPRKIKSIFRRLYFFTEYLSMLDTPSFKSSHQLRWGNLIWGSKLKDLSSRPKGQTHGFSWTIKNLWIFHTSRHGSRNAHFMNDTSFLSFLLPHQLRDLNLC